MKTKNEIIYFYLSCSERVQRLGKNTALGTSPCWLWSENSLTTDGEPVLRIRDLELYPQDILYRWYYGKPLDRRCVEFLCRSSRCLNPRHIVEEFDTSRNYVDSEKEATLRTIVGSATRTWRPQIAEFRRPSITYTKRQKVFRRDSFECVYCGFNMNLTIDHFIPYARGGDDSEQNLVTACWDCNGKKGSRYYWKAGLELKGGRFRQKAS